jgi:uncharacterized protein HemY
MRRLFFDKSTLKKTLRVALRTTQALRPLVEGHWMYALREFVEVKDKGKGGNSFDLGM